MASGLNDSPGRDERYRHIWCVFDVDEHPFLSEAQLQARDNNIDVAVPNPCFELWALLHFQDQRAAIGRADVKSLLRRHMHGYDKRLPCDTLHPFTDAARQRAVDLDRWHATRGTSGENPSTGVYRLVDIIRDKGDGSVRSVPQQLLQRPVQLRVAESESRRFGRAG